MQVVRATSRGSTTSGGCERRRPHYLSLLETLPVADGVAARGRGRHGCATPLDD